MLHLHVRRARIYKSGSSETAETMMITVFLDIMPFSVVDHQIILEEYLVPLSSG